MSPKEIEEAVTKLVIGEATAVKRGRDPRWPYVPVIRYPTHTMQLRNRAFATASEAKDCAATALENLRDLRRQQLLMPGQRALRESVGLPREVERIV